MNLNKQQRTMVYQVAVTIKKDNPTYSNHTCLEEAIFKCCKSLYDSAIPQSMEDEFELTLTPPASKEQ